MQGSLSHPQPQSPSTSVNLSLPAEAATNSATEMQGHTWWPSLSLSAS